MGHPERFQNKFFFHKYYLNLKLYFSSKPTSHLKNCESALLSKSKEKSVKKKKKKKVKRQENPNGGNINLLFKYGKINILFEKIV